MKPKHRQLLKLLENSATPLTGAQLAQSLMVAPRTVVNYIADINHAVPDSICSSHRGYQLSPQAHADRTYWQAFPDTPQCGDERMEKLLFRLLQQPEQRPVCEDFAEEMHVSCESIQKDLYILRPQLKKFGLRLCQENGELQLLGAEQAQRVLFAHVIDRMLNHTRLSAAAMASYFPQLPANDIQQALDNLLAERGYFINDCQRPNLLRDILIILSRQKSGCTLPPAAFAELPPAMAEDFPSAIRTALQPFSDMITASEAVSLCRTLRGYILPADFAHLTYKQSVIYLTGWQQSICTEFFIWLEQVLPFISQQDGFRLRMALNIANLLERKQQGWVDCNPQKEDMQNAAPLSFALAWQICQKLTAISGFLFTADDAAHLSVHLSLALKTQRQLNIDAVPCGLLITPYFDYATALRQELLTYFPHDIEIAAEAVSEKQMSELQNVQLIISTTPLPAGFSVPGVTTNPLLSLEKRQEIALHLHHQQLKNHRRLLLSFLQQHGQVTVIPQALMKDICQWLTLGTVALRLETGLFAQSRLLIEVLPRQRLQQGHRINVRLYLEMAHQDWEQTAYVLHDLIPLLQNFSTNKKQQAFTLTAFIETLQEQTPL